MITLGIDTAGPACAVALWQGDADRGGVLAARSVAMQRGHAEALMGLVEETVRDGLGEDAGAIQGVDRIAVLVGPGSFTGVRIGVAAARGLALALDVPAIGVSGFETVAIQHIEIRRPKAPFAVAFDAKRGQIYLQCFAADGSPLGEAAAVTPDAARASLPPSCEVAIGSGAESLAAAAARAGGVMLDAVASPDRDAGIVARLGAGRRPGDAPLPLYLRPPDAKPQRAPLARRPG